MNKPKIVIVGGGLTGCNLAQQLDNVADVVVLEKKKTYYNNVGSLRAVVYPEFVNNLFVPYKNALKHGKFVQAEVEEVRENEIKIRGLDTPMKFDYCIIAVGSVYNFPGRVPWWIGNLACKKMFNDCNAKLAKADRITIIGGGAVAIELCGEILDEFPYKNVTIIHSGKYLMSKQGLGEKIGRHVQTKLEAMGCHIILDETIVLEDDDELVKSQANLNVSLTIPSTNEGNEEMEGEKKASEIVKKFTSKFLHEGERELKSKSGKTYKTDLTFFCTGSSFPCEVYEKNFMLSKNYRCRTDNYLRALNSRGQCVPNVFVAGDCAGTPSNDGEGDCATLTFGLAHVEVIVKNIKKCIKVGSNTGFQLPKEYVAPPPIICVSTGRYGGVAGQGTKNGDGKLLFNFCGMNNYISKTLKSTHLYTDGTHKLFKAGKPKPLEVPRPKKTHIKSAKVQPSKQYEV